MEQININSFIEVILDHFNKQDELDISATKVTPQAKLIGDLSLDSLNIVDLHFYLEEFYGVAFELDCSEHSTVKDLTVEELMNLVQKAISTQPQLA